MTMSPERGTETTLIYNAGQVTAVITLNKDLRTADTYYFYLYNDEQMLIDFAATDDGTVERSGRSLRIVFSQPPVWLPGDYFLLMRNGSEQVFRFDITLDTHASFTATAPRPCPFLSLEHLLSSRLCMQKRMWQMLSCRPGLRQFRQEAIRRAQLAEMNRFRSQLLSVKGVEDIDNSNSYLICSAGYTMISQTLLLFRNVCKMDRECRVVDCTTLYDPTTNNPYEKLNDLFADRTSSDNALHLEMSNGPSPIYCLDHISALLETGGKTILKKLRRHCSNMMLIGSRQEIDNVLEQNPSLRSMFPPQNNLCIEPFTLKEIIFWFFQRALIHHLYFSPEAIDKTCHVLTDAYQQGVVARWTLPDFDSFIDQHVSPNYCRRLTECILSQKIDIADIEVLPDDIDTQPLFTQVSTYDSTLAELNAMIGLDDIKRSLTTIANNMHLAVERRQLGLHTSGLTSHHAIFMGNPGTGKTTVARLLGRIYHSLGLLSKGEVICVDRTRIIGRYIGETEENMKQLLQEAQGNVLFVDEAYTLYSNSDCNDFGRRAVECLLSVLSQKNPDMLIIFAGYQDEMDRLMSMNPGLVGRFPYKFLFKDYTTDELMQIAQSLLSADDYQLSDDAARQLAEAIRATQAQHSKHFGNARWVHQFVHNGIIPALANRLATTTHPFTREVYQRIEADDVQRAYELFNPKTIELKPHRQVGFSA